MPEFASEIPKAFEPYLEPAEQLKHWAYGFTKTPEVGLPLGCVAFLVAPLLTFFIMGGLVPLPLVGFFTILLISVSVGLILRFTFKCYVVGLTETRFLVLRLKPPAFFRPNLAHILSFNAYELDTLSTLNTSSGRRQTVIKIDDPKKRFFARFPHRGKGLQDNDKHARAISEALLRKKTNSNS